MFNVLYIYACVFVQIYACHACGIVIYLICDFHVIGFEIEHVFSCMLTFPLIIEMSIISRQGGT